METTNIRSQTPSATNLSIHKTHSMEKTSSTQVDEILRFLNVAHIAAKNAGDLLMTFVRDVPGSGNSIPRDDAHGAELIQALRTIEPDLVVAALHLNHALTVIERVLKKPDPLAEPENVRDRPTQNAA